MKRLIHITVFMLLTLVLPLGTSLAAPAPKVDVCHLDKDSGNYIIINISENAFQAHVDHGDGGPGDLVPGMPGKKFADDCSVVDVLDLSGRWRGQSGTSDTLCCWFDMDLTQESGEIVIVTGTFTYDDYPGRPWHVYGSLVGNNFYFRIYTDPGDPPPHYWANCDPCIVDASGNYFHGYGTDSLERDLEFEASR